MATRGVLEPPPHPAPPPLSPPHLTDATIDRVFVCVEKKLEGDDYFPFLFLI